VKPEIWMPIVMSAALAVSLGYVIVALLYWRLEKIMGPKPDDDVKGVPPEWMGFAERLVFGPAFYIAPEEAATGALVWLGLKMAANWQQQHPEISKKDHILHRRHSVRALLLGFVSLAIAAGSAIFVRWATP
jgi:hypothetical protein